MCPSTAVKARPASVAFATRPYASQVSTRKAQANSLTQRFAFYTTIPVFIIQLLLLSTAVYTLALSGRTAAHPSRLGSDMEKSQSQHELGQVQQRGQSFETKSESPQSLHTAQMGGAASKGVQFA